MRFLPNLTPLSDAFARRLLLQFSQTLAFWSFRDLSIALDELFGHPPRELLFSVGGEVAPAYFASFLKSSSMNVCLLPIPSGSAIVVKIIVLLARIWAPLSGSLQRGNKRRCDYTVRETPNPFIPDAQ